MYYPEQKVVVLGISNNLVEFDFESMEITKNGDTKSYGVLHIEKFNDTTFLSGEELGYLELIN